MTISGTSEVGVDRNIIDFWCKLHLVKVIIGGNSKNSGEVRFGEEDLAVVYHVDSHVGAGGVIIIFVADMCSKVINHRL